MIEKPDILLTGVCHVFILLKMRYENKIADAMKVVRPDYDPSKIVLIGDEEKRFRIVDLRGMFAKERYPTFHSMMNANSDCPFAYAVVNIELPSQDVAKRRYEGVRKYDPRWDEWVLGPGSGFWYHLYDKEWDVETAKRWRETRRLEMVKVLRDFPHLKFIVYTKGCVKWWKDNNFPQDRLLEWDVEWIADMQSKEEVLEAIRVMDGVGFHNFPTEDSYNELHDMIIKDTFE